MDLNQLLTEYDDSLAGDMNVDPLGLLVIWSAFGQDIFRYRVSSISNDVRNYTLNLFHHCLIKELVEDETFTLGKALNATYDIKDSIDFKYACLIYLENLFTYAMVARDTDPTVSKEGVLGIVKARGRWSNEDHNPTLLFGHKPESCILVRQTLLGVSGRYKTPLVQMGFFDKGYRYPLASASLWQKALRLLDTFPVYGAVRAHLRELLSQGGVKTEIKFNSIPQEVKAGYVETFRSPAVVGGYAKDFWLELSALDQGAAGALYRGLAPAVLQGKKLPSATLFAAAVDDKTLTAAEQLKIERIRQLEPFLAELDLMLTLLLSRKNQTLDEAAALWHQEFERNANTLPTACAEVKPLLPLLRARSVTGERRLARLLDVAAAGDIKTQMQALLDYHRSVMDERQQSPWLHLGSDGRLRLDVASREKPKKQDRQPGHWVNHYYIPQFRNLLQGLLGVAA
ncbi:hypothetical protein KUV95_12475 [Microbulbifer agarilyticus]|uniref:hypothetical protein n=1 Tax=Microbulbifer agarilyticus TaxID=260552 RepID=UPI001C979B94|nr:hypothetical protein [Microbulbifer agarilyticus]MBY6212366.1 hypothetical protein [Microbulbifer agarilyticus]